MTAHIDLLHATWLNLTFLNYEVDSGILQRYMPDGVELDTFNSRNYLSVVGLMHLHTEVAGVAAPVSPEYEQVNLRFYVKRPVASGGYEHGVVFIRQIVSELLPALGARSIYNEKLTQLPMRHAFEMPSDDTGSIGSFEYAWSTGAGDETSWHSINAATSGGLRSVQMGSKEEFLINRPYGFSGTPGLTALQYRVEHPTWHIWPSSHAKLDCDVKEVFGREFVPYLSGAPALAFVAEGSPVTVHLPHGLGERDARPGAQADS